MVDAEGLRRLKVFIKESAGFEPAARRLDVWPSTLRKVLTGRHISLPTRSKLDTILGEQIAKKRHLNHFVTSRLDLKVALSGCAWKDLMVKRRGQRSDKRQFAAYHRRLELRSEILPGDRYREDRGKS